jgi:hypothetical protein
VQFNHETDVFLDGAYSVATGAHPSGATVAYKKTWTPDPFNADAYATYSLLTGNNGSGLAERVAGGFISAIGYKGDLDSTMWDGLAGFAQLYTPGQTRPGSFTSIPQQPISRENIRIWLSSDNTFAPTGGILTKLKGVQEYTFKDDGIRQPDYDVDADAVSFAAVIEQGQDSGRSTTFSFRIHRNTQAEAMQVEWEAGTPIYLMYEAVGALIETGQHFTLQHQMYLLPTSYEAPDANNGVLDYTFNADIGVDGAWGGGSGIGHQFVKIGTDA